MAKKKPRSIDEFLGGLSNEKRAALQKLRRAIRAAAPEAEECIAYGVPAFRLNGKFLVAFGAGVNHCAFYPGGTAIAARLPELARYDVGKGTIRFQPGEGLPVALVRQIVRLRMGARGARRADGGTRRRTATEADVAAASSAGHNGVTSRRAF